MTDGLNLRWDKGLVLPVFLLQVFLRGWLHLACEGPESLKSAGLVL